MSALSCVGKQSHANVQVGEEPLSRNNLRVGLCLGL